MFTDVITMKFNAATITNLIIIIKKLKKLLSSSIFKISTIKILDAIFKNDSIVL